MLALCALSLGDLGICAGARCTGAHVALLKLLHQARHTWLLRALVALSKSGLTARFTLDSAAASYFNPEADSTKELRDRFNSVMRAIGFTGSAEINALTLNSTPDVMIDVPIGYWRKAQAIHNWFECTAREGLTASQSI